MTTDEALRVIGGFSLFRRSSSRASNPTTQGVTMRGLSASGSSRGLVLLDGVPLNDGFGGWVTWTRMPALATSSIAIDRGAEGSTFGSDALGGVHRHRRRAPAIAGSAQVAAMGGSLGVGAVDASAGGRTGPVGVVRRGELVSRRTASFRWRRNRAAPVDVPADAEWWSGFLKVTARRRPAPADVQRARAARDDRGNGTAAPAQHDGRRHRGSCRTTAVTATTGWRRGSRSVPTTSEQSFSTVARGPRDRNADVDAVHRRDDDARASSEAGRPIPQRVPDGARDVRRARRPTFKEVKPASTTAYAI